MSQVDLHQLLTELLEVRAGVVAMDHHVPPVVEANSESARNLLHYIGFRRFDLRSLQGRLASLGLSSLGRAETAVLDSLDAVISLLRLLEHLPDSSAKPPAMIRLDRGDALLERNTSALLGQRPKHRHVRIMVTMPTEAADDPGLIRDLLTCGMNCMRINCAHDGEPEWISMIANLDRAKAELGGDCPVLMDLPGPKLRTGALGPGPEVQKIRPQRDELGRVVRPAHVWLTSHAARVAAPLGAMPLPIEGELPAVGETLRFTDTRGAKRTLIVEERMAGGALARIGRTCYVGSGTVLHREPHPSIRVATLPAIETALLLRKGDTLILTSDPAPGRPAERNAHGNVLSPARIPCSLPEVFADVRVGHAIWLDDGKMGGTISRVTPTEIAVTMIHTASQGSKLRADKGINLPDTNLHLAALSPVDLELLPFVAKHADIVGYSFVRRPADIVELRRRLSELGAGGKALILKIETRQAFEELAHLLLEAMVQPVSGVMIARGDLAVECGYQRLAEIQEEILWICEAAHAPVIWATQVLENLAKSGLPSRAEITDAAIGERAECVMLNKGPYVVEATRALDDILLRMESHHAKKRAMLRELHVADRFGDAEH